VETVGNSATMFETPSCIVLKISDTFNDVPVPSERQFLKYIQMPSYKRFTIENDCKEMDWEHRINHLKSQK